ncbi:MAG: hypothetical protein JWN52_5021 [Actinomycetia bacterium]|nr:hypothetical protein [Actinomycetes bacterium]
MASICTDQPNATPPDIAIANAASIANLRNDYTDPPAHDHCGDKEKFLSRTWTTIPKGRSRYLPSGVRDRHHEMIILWQM